MPVNGSRWNIRGTREMDIYTEWILTTSVMTTGSPHDEDAGRLPQGRSRTPPRKRAQGGTDSQSGVVRERGTVGRCVGEGVMKEDAHTRDAVVLLLYVCASLFFTLCHGLWDCIKWTIQLELYGVLCRNWRYIFWGNDPLPMITCD